MGESSEGASLRRPYASSCVRYEVRFFPADAGAASVTVCGMRRCTHPSAASGERLYAQACQLKHFAVRKQHPAGFRQSVKFTATNHWKHCGTAVV